MCVYVRESVLQGVQASEQHRNHGTVGALEVPSQDMHRRAMSLGCVRTKPDLRLYIPLAVSLKQVSGHEGIYEPEACRHPDIRDAESGFHAHIREPGKPHSLDSVTTASVEYPATMLGPSAAAKHGPYFSSTECAMRCTYAQHKARFERQEGKTTH